MLTGSMGSHSLTALDGLGEYSSQTVKVIHCSLSRVKIIIFFSQTHDCDASLFYMN